MTLKEAIWREIKFGMCGAGGVWDDVVDPDHVCLDARDDIDAENAETDYPWVIIGRMIKTQPQSIGRVSDRMAIATIGLLRSEDKGDDLLEQLQEDLEDHFHDKHMTIGKFSATGVAEPNGGLRVHGRYINTTDGFSENEDEKVQIGEFAFAYTRA